MVIAFLNTWICAFSSNLNTYIGYGSTFLSMKVLWKLLLFSKLEWGTKVGTRVSNETLLGVHLVDLHWRIHIVVYHLIDHRWSMTTCQISSNFASSFCGSQATLEDYHHLLKCRFLKGHYHLRNVLLEWCVLDWHLIVVPYLLEVNEKLFLSKSKKITNENPLAASTTIETKGIPPT